MESENKEKHDIVKTDSKKSRRGVVFPKRKRFGDKHEPSWVIALPVIIDKKSKDSLYSKSETYNAEAEQKSRAIRTSIEEKLAQPEPPYIGNLVTNVTDEQRYSQKNQLLHTADSAKSRDLLRHLLRLYDDGIGYKGTKIDGNAFLAPLAAEIARLLETDISAEDKLEIFIDIRLAFEASIRGDDDLLRDICFVFRRMNLEAMLWEYFDALHFSQLDSAIPQEIDNLILALKGRTLYFHCEHSVLVDSEMVDNLSTRMSAIRVFERAVEVHDAMGVQAAIKYLAVFAEPGQKSAIPVSMPELLRSVETRDVSAFVNSLLYVAYDLVLEERTIDGSPSLLPVDVTTNEYRRMVLGQRVGLLAATDDPDSSSAARDARRSFLKKFAIPVFGLLVVDGEKLDPALKKNPGLLTRIHDLSNLIFVGVNEQFEIDSGQKTSGMVMINSTVKFNYHYAYDDTEGSFPVDLGHHAQLQDDFLYVFTTIREKCGNFAADAFGDLRMLLETVDTHMLDEDGFWKNIIESHFIHVVSVLPLECGLYASGAFSALGALLSRMERRFLEDERFWKALTSIPPKCGIYTVIAYEHIGALLSIVEKKMLDNDEFWMDIIEDRFLSVIIAISAKCENLTYSGYDIFQTLLTSADNRQLGDSGFWKDIVGGHFLDVIFSIFEIWRSSASGAYESLQTLIASADKRLLNDDEFWKKTVKGHFLATVASISDKIQYNAENAYASLRVLLSGIPRSLLSDEKLWRVIESIPDKCGWSTSESYASLQVLLGRIDERLISEERFWRIIAVIPEKCGTFTGKAYDSFGSLLSNTGKHYESESIFWESITIDESGTITLMKDHHNKS